MKPLVPKTFRSLIYNLDRILLFKYLSVKKSGSELQELFRNRLQGSSGSVNESSTIKP